MREGRKTTVQPLGTNAERETETQGMARAIMDFDEQMGISLEAARGMHRQLPAYGVGRGGPQDCLSKFLLVY